MSFAVGPLSLDLCLIFQLNSLQTWILSMLIAPTQKSGYIMWCFLQIFTTLHGISHPPFFFPSLCWKEKMVLTMPEALSLIPHQRVSDSKSRYSRHPIREPLLPCRKEFSGQPAPGGGRWRARGSSSHGQSPMRAQVPKHSGVSGQRLYLHTTEPGALTGGCFHCK